MVTIGLFMLIGLFYSIKVLWNGVDYFSEIIGAILGTIWVLFCAFMLGGLVSWLLPMKTEENIITYNIVSLQDNNSSKGNYFIGSGRSEGKMKYSFYYKSDGGFKLKEIDYKNTTIIYSDSIRIEQFGEKEVDSFINYFAFDNFLDEDYMKFKIYIPEGTIKTNFTLDAE